ncbi:MAG: alpha-glucan family phosphorylase [Candidatus Margulisiibacteriota bacterium]
MFSSKVIEFHKRKNENTTVQTVFGKSPSMLDSAERWNLNFLKRLGTRMPVMYYSLEYMFSTGLHIYSGGLGNVAADYTQAGTDIGVPMVSVGLYYEKGYFKQSFDADGKQNASPEKQGEILESIPHVVTIQINGRDVKVGAKIRWSKGADGRQENPTILLDTKIDGNDEWARSLTDYLYQGQDMTYDGDESARRKMMRAEQEVLLGIGGLAMMKALKLKPSYYHLNEGHAAFAISQLCKDRVIEMMVRDHVSWANLSPDQRNGYIDKAVEENKEKTGFTTHTPVEAGHDVFDQDLLEQHVIHDEMLRHINWRLGVINDNRQVNTTAIAGRAGKVNGVAWSHGLVSEKMPVFEAIGVKPIAIVNGIDTNKWVSKAMAKVYDKWTPAWRTDARKIAMLQDIFEAGVENQNLWLKKLELMNDIKQAHATCKHNLVDYLNREVAQYDRYKDMGLEFREDVITIGAARRFNNYKRTLAWLEGNIDNLIEMSRRTGKPIQFVFAGKAHPYDDQSIKLLQRMHELIAETNNRADNTYTDNNADGTTTIGKAVQVVYVDNYNPDIAAILTSGVDIWGNIPLEPLEASGTSGEKAIANAVPNLSAQDGWWAEPNCSRGFGYTVNPHFTPITSLEGKEKDVPATFAALREQLMAAMEQAVIDYNNHFDSVFLHKMTGTVAYNVPIFNAHRVAHAYNEYMWHSQERVYWLPQSFFNEGQSSDDFDLTGTDD